MSLKPRLVSKLSLGNGWEDDISDSLRYGTSSFSRLSVKREKKGSRYIFLLSHISMGQNLKAMTILKLNALEIILNECKNKTMIIY